MNLFLRFVQPFLTVFLVLSACADPPQVSRSSSKTLGEEPLGELTNEDVQKLYLSFDSTLKPLMRERCASCHTEVGGGIGPKTIYQNVAMVGLAKAGKSSGDNKLVNKLLNKISHGGGSQCVSLDKSPCVEFVAWAKQLYRSKGTTTSSATKVPTVTNPPADNSSDDASTGDVSTPSSQTSAGDTSATNLAALEGEYNSSLNSLIDSSCNGSGCHSSRSSKLTTFQGVKRHASDSLKRINNGSMPIGRSLSKTDKTKLTSFLGKLSQ